MEPQMTNNLWWWEVDTLEGGITFLGYSDFTPEQVKAMFEHQTINSMEVVLGYGTRWSAPGYMDCTEWEVHEKESDAQDKYNEMKQEIIDAEYHEARTDWSLSRVAPLGDEE
jgi:hypothetical protein